MGRSGHFLDPAAGEPEEEAASPVRTLVRVLPALLILAGIVYDYATPRHFTAIPFFTAAPLIAAPLSSLRTTVVTGAVAFLAQYVVHLRFGFSADADSITETVTVATVAVLAVVINRVVRRGDRRLASAREIAEAVQRAVLPEPEARIGGFEIAARYEAAHEGAFIGGDLYAVQDTAYGVRVVLGDVRGKGMGAVAAVSVVIGAFREAAEQEATLEAVAQRLERALARDGARRDGPEAAEGFTTALLAELPHGDGIVRILNRGHPRPCSSPPTAPCAPWTRPHPRCRSAWATWATGPTAWRRPPAGRRDAAPAHRRAVRGPRRARHLLRPGRPAHGPRLPRPGHPARHPRGRGAPALGRQDHGRHGAARRTTVLTAVLAVVLTAVLIGCHRR